MKKSSVEHSVSPFQALCSAAVIIGIAISCRFYSFASSIKIQTMPTFGNHDFHYYNVTKHNNQSTNITPYWTSNKTISAAFRDHFFLNYKVTKLNNQSNITPYWTFMETINTNNTNYSNRDNRTNAYYNNAASCTDMAPKGHLANPRTSVTLIIAGGAKTGTTALAEHLNEFNDIVYYGRESPYWSSCVRIGFHESRRNQIKQQLNQFVNSSKPTLTLFNLSELFQRANYIDDNYNNINMIARFRNQRRKSQKHDRHHSMRAGTIDADCNLEIFENLRVRHGKDFETRINKCDISTAFSDIENDTIDIKKYDIVNYNQSRGNMRQFIHFFLFLIFKIMCT